jgi:hypothetical protein
MADELPEPLPALVRLADHGGDERYFDVLFAVFLREVVDAGFTFRGLPIRFRFKPDTDGKHFAFWHFITGGKAGDREEDRIPDMRRCELVPWVGWLLRHAETFSGIRSWEEKRGSQPDVLFWLHEHDFVVVISQRDGYYLFKTAYPVQAHKWRSLEREWVRATKG